MFRTMNAVIMKFLIIKYFIDKLSISTLVNINISALVNVNISALVNVNLIFTQNKDFRKCVFFLQTHLF
jgi:hypothetical protein